MISNVIKEPKKVNLQKNSNIEEPNKTPFSEEEFLHELTTTIETSPGYHQITYSMIKQSCVTFQTAILNLYNKKL